MFLHPVILLGHVGSQNRKWYSLMNIHKMVCCCRCSTCWSQNLIHFSSKMLLRSLIWNACELWWFPIQRCWWWHSKLTVCSQINHCGWLEAQNLCVIFFCLSFFIFCTQGSLNSPSFATKVDFSRCYFILYLLQFMWYQVPEQTGRLQFGHLQTDFSRRKIIQHFLLHCWKV